MPAANTPYKDLRVLKATQGRSVRGKDINLDNDEDDGWVEEGAVDAIPVPHTLQQVPGTITQLPDRPPTKVRSVPHCYYH